MDVLSIVAVVSGVVIGIFSAGSTYFNKQRFEAQIALLQTGNDELRSQNKDLRNERLDLTAQVAACKARDEEKEKLIENFKSQPNLASLTKLISNNHRQIMKALGSRDAK